MIKRPSSLRDQIYHSLRGFCQVACGDLGEDALCLVQEVQPHILLLDADLFRATNGFAEATRTIRNIYRFQPTLKIFCTSRDGLECAKALAPIGVHDVVSKPVPAELLVRLIRRACWLSEAESHHEIIQPQQCGSIEEMIGVSEAIQQVFSAIRKVAMSDLPVLITGESGTGKELTAKAIHDRSNQRDKPFVAINCGAIPETLIESELFGYERGAFTGAVQQKRGRIEAAEGGTLFLDEVGEVPLSLQVKLLRFLQEHQFERVGGQDSISIDVRVIAATNVNLKNAIQHGSFRDDLFYRLAVMHIHLPPLRERREDVLLMASTFLRQLVEQQDRYVKGFAVDAIRAMKHYLWPGNIRELLNKLRRAVVMADTPYITASDMELPLQGVPEEAVSQESIARMREKMEIQFLSHALARHQGNLSWVARDLQVSRPTLYRWLRRYGLDRKGGERDRTMVPEPSEQSGNQVRAEPGGNVASYFSLSSPLNM
jgi:two-component system NtrC family response regulator